MRTPIPKNKKLFTDVRTKHVDLTAGSVQFPRANKRTGMGTGQLLSGNPLIYDLYTNPPEPKVTENTVPNTFVCYIDTNPLGVQLEMIDDAGGRFKLVDRQILTAATPTDYEAATQHTITVTAGVGVYAVTKDFVIYVLDIDDGSGANDYFLDENGDFILDEDGNLIWG